MQRQGYSGSTIAGALGTLGAILSKAKRRGMIPANIVRELTCDERPKVGGGEKRVLSEAEIAAVLDAATDGFRPLIALLIFAGLRLGEALALSWEHVDFDNGFLHVREQLTRGRELAELKTGAGEA